MKNIKEVPRILVLMSVYNGKEYLEEQLESIFLQEGIEVSIVIRDDGSGCLSESFIDKWNKKLEIEVYNEKNIGAAKSFMRLIELAPETYDYYAFADQDDYWKPDKLIMAANCLRKQQVHIPLLYYSAVQYVGAQLEEIENPFKKSYFTTGFAEVMIVTEAPGCTMLFNVELLRCLKAYMPKVIYMHDEWTLQVCAAVGGKVICDETPHILYRQHGNNTVSGLEKMNYNFIQLFLYRIKKFLDFSYKPNLIAKELKQGYFFKMPDENKEILELLLNHSICGRFRLLFSNKVKTPYFVYNLKFRLQVLLNKI